MSGHVRTIEIEGHKFEVDLRTAKKIDTFRVGDKVKLLTKDYSGYEAHPGVIVGIDAFQKLPTVVIAYVPNPFSGDGKLKMAYLNADSKDMEICPMCEDGVMPTRETILVYFDRAIDRKTREIEEMVAHKEYFLRMYGATIAVAAENVMPVAEDLL